MKNAISRQVTFGLAGFTPTTTYKNWPLTSEMRAELVASCREPVPPQDQDELLLLCLVLLFREVDTGGFDVQASDLLEHLLDLQDEDSALYFEAASLQMYGGFGPCWADSCTYCSETPCALRS